MKNTATSDEQIVAALLTHGTIKEAAAVVGLSERTVYDRMTDGEFQALYKAAKADIVRLALHDLNSNLQTAIQTVVDVMKDDKANAAVRLQAARIILDGAAKFAQRLQTDEQAVANQSEANVFDIPLHKYLHR